MGDFREKLKRVESLDVLKTSLQEIAIDFVRKEKKNGKTVKWVSLGWSSYLMHKAERSTWNH